MRIIDADELILKHGDDITNWGNPCAVYISSIENAPTIEARPVVHAKWVWTVNGAADEYQYWVCSHCKKHTFYKTSFCADCGATMDLESEGKDE